MQGAVYHVACLLLAIPSAAPVAPSPDAVIRLPSAPLVPQPMPPADAAVRLAADQLYVIDSDLPVIVLASPTGLVAITEDTGPLKIRGRFVGGTGGTETRTYSGKHVVTVEALASGRVELLVVPVGAKTPAEVIRRTLDVDAGEAPRPPPKPPEPKPPDPKPDPTLPEAPDGVTRVLILFDPNQLTLQTENRKAVVYGQKTRTYLKGAVGDDGLRVYEATVQFQPGSTSPWKALAARGVKPGQFGTVIITRGGKVVTESEIPADPDAAIALFKKHLEGK